MERKSNKQQKLHIRKGDTVKILAGDDKAKTGKVLEISRRRKEDFILNIKETFKN